MSEERYPGETEGLRLFLSGLLVAVETTLGRDALLYHRVRAALERGDLQALRDARQMFNHQDIEVKRQLSLAGFEREDEAPRPEPDAPAATVLRLDRIFGGPPPAE
ncbi:MAG: hypothetical protein ACOC3D_10285 [Pseudomonadota bacterium]